MSPGPYPPAGAERALDQRLAVLASSEPVHGLPEFLRAPLSEPMVVLGAHVEDVVALLDHLGPGRAVLVGHSMGAFVTALTAARHPDREAYRAFFREHPALGPHWCDAVREQVDRDLTGEEPRLRSTCVPDAVRADGSDVLTDREVLAAVRTASGRCPW